MFSNVFTRKPKSPGASPHRIDLHVRKFHRIAVPASAAPYSMRSLQTAIRLADGASDAEIRLVYVIEVPRAFALGAQLPGEEAISARTLSQARRFVEDQGWRATAEVLRGRDMAETVLKYIVQQEIDLLVLGSRPDTVRGLPLDLARDLYDRAPCEAVIDYIAGERGQAAATDGAELR